MIHQLAARVFVSLLLATPLFAQDLQGLTPQELQEGAVSAVDNSDAQRLLDIMKEMQSRHLLFFTDSDREGCGREPARIGILQSKPFAWAAARQAYFAFLRQKQMARGDCGCITRQMTFDEFATQMFGATAATMNGKQYQELLEFKLKQENPTAAKHRDYVALNCVGE